MVGKAGVLFLRKKILQIFMVAGISVFVLTGCGSGSVSCGDAPAKNENATELAQESIGVQDAEELQDVDAPQNTEESKNTPATEGTKASGWGITLTAKDVTPEVIMYLNRMCKAYGASQNTRRI